MLTVRTLQMKVFEQAVRLRFEDEMVAHSREFSPKLSQVLGEKQLRVAVRAAITKAEGYGFTNRGPIRLFVEMTFLCGSSFDTDPQYPFIREVVCAAGDQMRRAEQIHEGALDYLEKVSGPNNAHVRQALEALLVLSKREVTMSQLGFVTDLLQEMTRVFPQKAARVGEQALAALVKEGITEALAYKFSAPREKALVVVLMFAFGHGCTIDPLYPWIQRTLTETRIVSPTARSTRLERKAVTWLNHVLGKPRNEEET
jgi:hypothetical protein